MNRIELTQIGRIIAGMTHEMNNVLAVVRTSNGLVQDIQSMGKKGLKFADKLARAADKIDNHSRRGVMLVQNMNAFGHSLDEPESEFDLESLLGNIKVLMERFARQQELELLHETNKPDRKTRTQRMRALLAVTFLVDALMETLPAGAKIVMQDKDRDGAPMCAVGAEGAAPDENALLASLPDLEETLAGIGGRVVVLGGDPLPGLGLVLPSA
jgi:signal transduction histidine kinase